MVRILAFSWFLIGTMQFLTTQKYTTDVSISLICRRERMLIIGLEGPEYNNYTISVYDDVLIQKKEFSVLPKIYAIKKLKSDILYEIRLNFNSNDTDREIISHFSTLSDDYNLTRVVFANFTQILSRGSLLSLILSWTPGPERICDYDILIWAKGYMQDLVQISPEYHELYNTELQDLRFSTNYSVAIYPYTEGREGPKYWVNFTTPSCNEINDYNYTICQPAEPEGLTIKEKECNVTVNWSRPFVNPDSYVFEIVPHNGSYERFHTEINGNESFFSFDAHNYSDFFTIFLKAEAISGQSQTVYKEHKNLCYESEESNNSANFNMLLLYYTIPSVLVMAVTFSLICLAVVKVKKTIDLNTTEDDPKVKEMKLPNESKYLQVDDLEYEIPKENITLLEVIGEGEFGIVHRAKYTYEKGKQKDVAVKVLKEHATYEDKKQLEKEVEVMKRVGTHANIVSLVGYCSSNFLLVVEYCSQGNLQIFLRNVWKTKLLIKELNNSGEIPNDTGVFNFLYGRTDLEKKHLSLTTTDLISFARQISIGMEYLSRNRVIHRDLAARNVLLTSNLTAKISDFGLSRDIYEENVYKKKTVARLPIKWMAIESLVHHIFTTQSDMVLWRSPVGNYDSRLLPLSDAPLREYMQTLAAGLQDGTAASMQRASL
ncbi:tyrosine-protein kinase receptor torso-like [Cimex lectularius]|uniref:receptor protein-tyrosine kinase n=1 Tax=Cimex lectularius TaxID=79782 RepID=A0A8I6SKL0_CIMLE|nr:tyrosine-protein kinase receptor torso-like [Cimex lectularius]